MPTDAVKSEGHHRMPKYKVSTLFWTLKIYLYNNVTNCKKQPQTHVDNKVWSDKIEDVGKETTEWTNWPSRNLEVWVRKISNHKIVRKFKTEIENENK